MAPLLQFVSSASQRDDADSSCDSRGARSSSSSSSSSSAVSFNDRVGVKKIRHIKDYSEKEISACWYSQQDFEKMQSRHIKMQRYFQKRLNALASSKKQDRQEETCSSSRENKQCLSELPEQIVIDTREQEATSEVMTQQAQEVIKTADIEALVSTTDANLKDLESYRDDLLRQMSEDMGRSDKIEIAKLLYSTRLHMETLQEHRNTLLSYRQQQ